MKEKDNREEKIRSRHLLMKGDSQFLPTPSVVHMAMGCVNSVDDVLTQAEETRQAFQAIRTLMVFPQLPR